MREAPPAAARSIISQLLAMIGPFVHDAFAGRVVFGAGRSRSALAGELEQLGAERALVICSRRDAGLATALCAPFAGRVAGRFEEGPRARADRARRARAGAGAPTAGGLPCVHRRRLGDRDGEGRRNGAGGNIYTYHFDPAGAIVEYAADLYRVWDEATYAPGRRSLDDHRFANLWGPGPPIEMMETATPQA